MDEKRIATSSEPKTGYWIEFNRGWWSRNGADNGLKRSEQSVGLYHGSVTEEQAKQLEALVRDFLDGKDDSPRLTAIGARGFIERLLTFWRKQDGAHAKEQVAELAAMVARSETAALTTDQIFGWSRRHDIHATATDLRAMIDDARSL